MLLVPILNARVLSSTCTDDGTTEPMLHVHVGNSLTLKW
jgi:hypothetical protein